MTVKLFLKIRIRILAIDCIDVNILNVYRPSVDRALHWRHNDHHSVSNHQPHGCLLNRLFRPTSKKTSKLRVTGLCAGNSPGPVNSPHKGPVTRKMFPFDDVIMGRQLFFQTIREIATKMPKDAHLAVVGDFNVVFSNELDMIVGNKHQECAFEKFNNCRCQWEVFDIWCVFHENEKEYTWCRCYHSKAVGLYSR